MCIDNLHKHCTLRTTNWVKIYLKVLLSYAPKKDNFANFYYLHA